MPYSSQPFSVTHAHENALWAALMLEELSRLGLQDCCIAPGSRSTPLTLAAARHDKIRTHIHFDERGLGFFALGLAKATQRPVAIITTSGTAVANLYPAIVEASLTGVPLIVLSADRPPHLVDCGANQAIEQPRIFSDYPRWQTQLPTPSKKIPAQFLLTTLDNAWRHTQGENRGPIHLNCPFDEPLYPGPEIDFSEYLAPLTRWLSSQQPWTVWHQAPACTTPESSVWASLRKTRGIIIAGQLDSVEDAQAVAELAEKLGWPLVADLQSHLRSHPNALHFADQLLHSSEIQTLLSQTETVLQFGSRLISKRWLTWLKQQPLKHYWLVAPDAQRLDPDHIIHQRFVTPVAQWCSDALSQTEHQPKSPQSGYQQLCQASQRYGVQLDTFVSQQQKISEVGVAYKLLELLPEQGPLFVGNSLPPRLLDMFARPGMSDQTNQVFTNRGASGIDGLIATACGIAAGSDQQTTLLLGDLSFLHDLNSLAMVKQLSLPPVIILLNNDGGSIFRLLPGPGDEQLARSCYQLPHGLTARHACAMFDIDYHAPHTLAEFERDFAQAQQKQMKSRPQLIEVIVPEDGSQQDIRALAALANLTTELSC